MAKIAKNGPLRHNREILRMKIKKSEQSFLLLCYFTTYVWERLFSEIGQKQNISVRKKLSLSVKLIDCKFDLENCTQKLYTRLWTFIPEFFMVLLCSNKKLWASKKVWLAYRTPSSQIFYLIMLWKTTHPIPFLDNSNWAQISCKK